MTSFAKVPIWLEKFVFLIEGGASLVGPVSSCEIEVHVQSWMFVFTADAHDIVRLRMRAACSPALQWSDAIKLSEIGISHDLLSNNLALSSLYPSFKLLTRHHRSALNFGVAEIREKMFDCRNPLLTLDGNRAGEDLLSIVFVKYGGEVFRQGLLTPQLNTNMKYATRLRFPSAPEDSCIKKL